MRFSILQFLIATAITGGIVGIAIRDGILVAAWLTILVTFFGVCIARSNSGWSGATRLQRVYAVAASTASGLLLAGVVYAFGTSDDLAHKRNTRDLQRLCAVDWRFSEVNITYNESKGGSVWVEGTVHTEDDFQELRKCLYRYDWSSTNGINWRVSVSNPKQIYGGWDVDLFGETKH